MSSHLLFKAQEVCNHSIAESLSKGNGKQPTVCCACLMLHVYKAELKLVLSRPKNRGYLFR